jgi:hypothetical protein
MFGRLLPHFSRVAASAVTVSAVAVTAVSFSRKEPISYADAVVGSGGGIIDDYHQGSNSLPTSFPMGKLPFAGAQWTSSSTATSTAAGTSGDGEEGCAVVAFNLEEYMRARRAEEADREPVPDG